MADQTFAEDMQLMLRTAETLLKESDTEETRMYVQTKLKEMQSYLQEKQKQGEKALEERIKKEEESIQILEERIERIKDGSVTENEALNYHRMYLDLKENEWSEAFNALLENEKNAVERILYTLIDILKITYGECQKLQSQQNTELAKEARYADDTPADKKDLRGLTVEQDKELRGHVKYLQDKTAQYCVDSISKKSLSNIKSNQTIAKYYKQNKQSERVVAAFDEYINKCIQFSWVAHFEHPPIHLITDPNRECPKITDQFDELKNIQHAKFVEWPALVKGVELKSAQCEVKAPWQLYDKHRKRPTARPQKQPTPPPEKEPEARVEKLNEDINDDRPTTDPDSQIRQLENEAMIHLPGSNIVDNDPGKADLHIPKPVSRQPPAQRPNQSQPGHRKTSDQSGMSKPQMNTRRSSGGEKHTSVVQVQQQKPNEARGKAATKTQCQKTQGGDPRASHNTNF